LLAVAGLGIDYVLHAIAPNLFWLFVGRALAGVCGASYVIANAFIADVTEAEDRAKAFGLMGAAFGIGFVVGPAIGGLLGAYGPRVPFYVAAAISALNLVYGYFVLPETLPKEKRRPFDWRRSNPIGTLKVFSKYPSVLPLSLIFFIFFTASAVYPAIWPFWGKAKFDWSTATVGLTLAAFGIVTAMTQATLTGPIVKRWGEPKVIMIGLASAIIAAIGYGFAPSLLIVLILIFIHAPEGFVHPLLTAMMSKQVPEDAQGELQGGIGSIMALAMLLGTVLFSQLFGYFMQPNPILVTPDISYFVAGMILIVATVMFVSLTRGNASLRQSSKE
jgi:MFS transporter, DHA1 family, tetracycline resistance protein